MEGYDPSELQKAITGYRAEQARQVGANVYPIRQDPIGCNDIPVPPLKAYDETSGSGPRFANAEPKRTSKFFSAATLHGKAVPPREWLVEELIPSRTVTMLSGDGGTGKSLLALQLAIATAIGQSWIGRSVKAGAAVYLSAEDEEDELHRRAADLVHSFCANLGDLGNLTLRSLAGEDALIALTEGPNKPLFPTSLCKEIEDVLIELKPALLVLDTLADLYCGNENDRAQVRQFIGILRGLAQRNNCAVLLLAHPSLSGLNSGSGSSGSTAWNNSVRSRLYFERVTQDGYEGNTDARVLRTKKANYGPVGGEITMTWRDGVFVPDTPETGLDRMAGNAKAERVFLKLLRMLADQGRYVNASSGVNYAPSAFEKHPDREGVNKFAFRGAMEKLLSNKSIQVKQGKRSTYLEEVSK